MNRSLRTLELVEQLEALPGFRTAFPVLSTFQVEQVLPSPRPYQVVG